MLAAAGTPSDLLWMDQQWAGPFREQDMLRVLDPFIKRDTYALDDFFPVAQQFYQFKGQTFGVLHTASPRIFVYNKTLFDKKGVKPPTNNWTWGDLRDALRRLTGGSGEEATFGGAMGRNLEFPGFVYQNGGKLVDDMHLPTKSLLDQPAALEGVQFHVDLELKDGVSVADAKRTGGLTPAQLWMAGRLGIRNLLGAKQRGCALDTHDEHGLPGEYLTLMLQLGDHLADRAHVSRRIDLRQDQPTHVRACGSFQVPHREAPRSIDPYQHVAASRSNLRRRRRQQVARACLLCRSDRVLQVQNDRVGAPRMRSLDEPRHVYRHVQQRAPGQRLARSG
ncbi:MAG: extracellular solute-binding protein [Chloroflexi bacterium]|nr:extracellular solute-binding protein [Chloroflexota bacterium]